MTCICKGASGVGRRPDLGSQLGCPRHGKEPLSEGRIALIEKTLDDIDAAKKKHPASAEAVRWGTCYDDGEPFCVEWRDAHGRGDYGSAARFSHKKNPPVYDTVYPVAELIGLLDPVAVRELVRLARLGLQDRTTRETSRP